MKMCYVKYLQKFFIQGSNLNALVRPVGEFVL